MKRVKSEKNEERKKTKKREKSEKVEKVQKIGEGQKVEESKKVDKRAPRLSAGARNLLILGVGATAIAITTTAIGLIVYHASGDIYLDRSRPGYLPDEEEMEGDNETKPEEYTFEKSGKLSKETIDEYLEHLEAEIKAVDAYEKPFASERLSDERLGIPAAEEEPAD